ncbi:hypothetical protein KO16_23280 [Salmonella enterica subsp. enterica serovar Heidelberg]|nr:hypothetical protein [Salmonella enterica subsp. enterica serovar Heidelberg]
MIPAPGLNTLFIVRAKDCPSGNISYTPLGHLQPLADLTPLIAKLGYCPDAGLQFWAGLLSLAPIMRKVPADTD